MEEVILKIDGFYIRRNDELEKLEKLNTNLTDYIEIDKDVTFGDFFKVLMNHESEIEYLFESWTRGFKLKPYYEQLLKDVEEETPIKYIEVNWATDYMEWENDEMEVKKDFSMYINVTGYSDEDHYSIALTDVNNIKYIPLRINKFHKTKGFVFIDEENIDRDLVDIFEGETDITLQDFIGGILYEISFHGYPEEKIEFSKELEEMVDEIELANECVTADEFELDFLERDLDRLVNEEKYEKAEKVKKQIEKLKKQIEKSQN